MRSRTERREPWVSRRSSSTVVISPSPVTTRSTSPPAMTWSGKKVAWGPPMITGHRGAGVWTARPGAWNCPGRRVKQLMPTMSGLLSVSRASHKGPVVVVQIPVFRRESAGPQGGSQGGDPQWHPGLGRQQVRLKGGGGSSAVWPGGARSKIFMRAVLPLRSRVTGPPPGGPVFASGGSPISRGVIAWRTRVPFFLRFRGVLQDPSWIYSNSAV